MSLLLSQVVYSLKEEALASWWVVAEAAGSAGLIPAACACCSCRSGKSKGFPLFSCPDKNKVNFIPRGSAFCPVKLLCSSLFSPVSPSSCGLGLHGNGDVAPSSPAAASPASSSSSSSTDSSQSPEPEAQPPLLLSS